MSLLEGAVIVVALTGVSCTDLADEGIEGRYLAHFEQPVDAVEAASVALDAFHGNTAIGVLDDFDIHVETEDGAILSEPDGAEAYASTVGAFITRID